MHDGVDDHIVHGQACPERQHAAVEWLQEPGAVFYRQKKRVHRSLPGMALLLARRHRMDIRDHDYSCGKHDSKDDYQCRI
jgi:hypothetical protein